MIGQLNRRIQLKAWGSDQDEIGAPVKNLVASYGIWAQVEDRSGHLYTGEQQATWNYDYKITFRYERSRPVSSNFTIDYDNKRLAINSVACQNEGNRRFVVTRCTTVDAAISSPDGPVVPEITRALRPYSYYGIGGETDWTEPDLISKTIIGAFKDGVGFEVLLETDTPLTPVGKQVVYVPATGQFRWGEAYEPDEYSLIQYY